MLASSKQKCSKTSAFPKSYYSCQNTSNYFALTVQQTQRTAFGNIYTPLRWYSCSILCNADKFTYFTFNIEASNSDVTMLPGSVATQEFAYNT